MPNNNGKSGDGAPLQGNATHKEEAREKTQMSPEVLEMMALYRQGPAEAEARIRMEHAKWKSKKALDDVIGKDTDKWIKRFCVAEVAAYYKSVKFAENKPNAAALNELARRTALSGLSKLFPNIPREKLSQLLNYKLEELEDP
jgi:hypothetical protein